MKSLNIEINKIKSIDKLSISLPISKGLYAITGQNGSGKSTVVTCAAMAFFNMKAKDYFGDTESDSSIVLELDGVTRIWKKDGDKWKKFPSKGSMNIKGYYEGSIIFGKRFRNANYALTKTLESIDDQNLEIASDFVRTNLGFVLHNNTNYYEKLYKINIQRVNDKLSGDLFYYEKNDKRVSQFHMSTGENLLLSILDSIERRNNDRGSLEELCVLFFDEIELALHPSSLRRLLSFLKQMSDEYNYSIYFATHSIELISGIDPVNIFFLEKHQDGSIEILNPCYPAYATRSLYDHSGYDYIILVEDDLARYIISALLDENRLWSSKLIHILPCGGYLNVINLAQEIYLNNLFGETSKIFIILDGDVKKDAERYIKSNKIKNTNPLNYLPIESLEKYLRSNLHENLDPALFRFLNDNIFHKKSLSKILEEYRNSEESFDDKNGKKLYTKIDNELKKRKKSRTDFIRCIVQYLIDENGDNIQKLTRFFKNHFAPKNNRQ